MLSCLRVMNEYTRLRFSYFFHPTTFLSNLPAYLSFKMYLFNRSWHIFTTPNTTKIFLIIFKLIQQSNMVILSCLEKINQNLNARKKKFSLFLKREFRGHFSLENATFSNKLNFFSSHSNFDFSSQGNSE